MNNYIFTNSGSTSPSIVAYMNKFAQTTGTTLISYVDSGGGDYEISGFLNVTAILESNLDCTLHYTDENGVPQSYLLGASNTASPVLMTVYPFRVQVGSTITIVISFASGSSATYDAGAILMKLGN